MHCLFRVYSPAGLCCSVVVKQTGSGELHVVDTLQKKRKKTIYNLSPVNFPHSFKVQGFYFSTHIHKHMTNRLNTDGGGQNGTTWKPQVSFIVEVLSIGGSHYRKGIRRGTIYADIQAYPWCNNTQKIYNKITGAGQDYLRQGWESILK